MNDGGPAFPFTFDDAADRCTVVTPGMTLRDYFAAAALQGLITSMQDGTPVFTARLAYDYADAMITQREKIK